MRPRKHVVPALEDASVTVQALKPAPGEYRMVLGLVSDRGAVKDVSFTIGPEILPNLTERWMWDRFFYPALLALKGTM